MSLPRLSKESNSLYLIEHESISTFGTSYLTTKAFYSLKSARNYITMLLRNDLVIISLRWHHPTSGAYRTLPTFTKDQAKLKVKLALSKEATPETTKEGN